MIKKRLNPSTEKKKKLVGMSNFKIYGEIWPKLIVLIYLMSGKNSIGSSENLDNILRLM
jgi:hypothetical protein